jgi:hypothetical protein
MSLIWNLSFSIVQGTNFYWTKWTSYCLNKGNNKSTKHKVKQQKVTDSIVMHGKTKTKWLWMQKKPQTLTGVLVKRSYNNGFHSYYTLYAISIDGTGVAFYWQNTINALAIGTKDRYCNWRYSQLLYSHDISLSSTPCTSLTVSNLQYNEHQRKYSKSFHKIYWCSWKYFQDEKNNY